MPYTSQKFLKWTQGTSGFESTQNYIYLITQSVVSFGDQTHNAQRNICSQHNRQTLNRLKQLLLLRGHEHVIILIAPVSTDQRLTVLLCTLLL